MREYFSADASVGDCRGFAFIEYSLFYSMEKTGQVAAYRRGNYATARGPGTCPI